MRIAALAWPTGSLIVAGVALAALAIPRGHRETPAPVYSAQAEVVVDVPVDVPGNARYFSIDLDGDGTPELAAESADHAHAVIVKAYGHAPIATIPLTANGCTSELAIDDARLVAHDYEGPDCHESDTRIFRIRDGQLATVTVFPTHIEIVDN